MGIFSISFHQNTLCITSYNQKLISRSIKHLTEQNCCKWWSKGFLCGVFYRLCLHLVPHSNVTVIRRVFLVALLVQLKNLCRKPAGWTHSRRTAPFPLSHVSLVLGLCSDYIPTLSLIIHPEGQKACWLTGHSLRPYPKAGGLVPKHINSAPQGKRKGKTHNTSGWDRERRKDLERW